MTAVSVKHHPHLHSPHCPLPTEHLGWAGGALRTSFASERLQVCGISEIFWYSSIRAKSGRAVLVCSFFFSFFFSFSFLCVWWFWCGCQFLPHPNSFGQAWLVTLGPTPSGTSISTPGIERPCPDMVCSVHCAGDPQSLVNPGSSASVLSCVGSCP